MKMLVRIGHTSPLRSNSDESTMNNVDQATDFNQMTIEQLRLFIDEQVQRILALPLKTDEEIVVSEREMAFVLLAGEEMTRRAKDANQ